MSLKPLKQLVPSKRNKVRPNRRRLSHPAGLSCATSSVLGLISVKLTHNRSNLLRASTNSQRGSFCSVVVVLSFVLPLLVSCSAAYHIRRAEKQIKKAEEKGATWRRDTTWQNFVIKSPAITNTLTVKWPDIKKDTTYITRDSIQVYWRTTVVKKDSLIYVEIKCPEQDVKAKVPVAVENKLQARGIRWWWIAVALLVGVLTGGYVMLRYYQREDKN